MDTGTYISGLGHLGLLAIMTFGGLFASEPPPFEVQEVAVISGEEFAALVAAQQPPETATEVAALAPVPEETPETPEAPAASDAPDRPEAPQPAPAPESEEAPETAALQPVPEAEVTDTAPQITPPDDTDVAVALPPRVVRPKSRPVDRVAPQPVAQPAPDTKVDDVVREAVRQDEASNTPSEETEATAPEEAATEIVTEEKAGEDLAPLQSKRPVSRPSRPQTAETAPSTSDAVNAALEAALAGGGESAAAPAPSGPPLTSGERDALRVAVQQCWVVDVGSQAANVTVVLGMSMERDGTVRSGSIRMISSTGGDGAAVQTAFQAARRAVLRCQRGGYNLPGDKYDQWRDIEMTFNPEKMRNK